MGRDKELVKKLNSNLDIADIKAILKGRGCSIKTFDKTRELVEFIKNEDITKAVVVMNNKVKKSMVEAFMVEGLLEETTIGISNDEKIRIAY